MNWSCCGQTKIDDVNREFRTLRIIRVCSFKGWSHPNLASGRLGRCETIISSFLSQDPFASILMARTNNGTAFLKFHVFCEAGRRLPSNMNYTNEGGLKTHHVETWEILCLVAMWRQTISPRGTSDNQRRSRPSRLIFERFIASFTSDMVKW